MLNFESFRSFIEYLNLQEEKWLEVIHKIKITENNWKNKI